MCKYEYVSVRMYVVQIIQNGLIQSMVVLPRSYVSQWYQYQMQIVYSRNYSRNLNYLSNNFNFQLKISNVLFLENFLMHVQLDTLKIIMNLYQQYNRIKYLNSVAKSKNFQTVNMLEAFSINPCGKWQVATLYENNSLFGSYIVIIGFLAMLLN